MFPPLEGLHQTKAMFFLWNCMCIEVGGGDINVIISYQEVVSEDVEILNFIFLFKIF